jgi:hypothetical protein
LLEVIGVFMMVSWLSGKSFRVPGAFVGRSSCRL